MTIELPDSGVSYPAEQALYLVSVRYDNYLPSASFRFHLTMDTLAFDYEIPVITALSGLAPCSVKTCPAQSGRKRLTPLSPHTTRHTSIVPRRFLLTITVQFVFEWIEAHIGQTIVYPLPFQRLA